MENLLRRNNIMFHEKERKIKAILKEISNHKCIDCNKPNPEYISLNNSVFLCQTCFKRHSKFPISVSKPIRNNLFSLTLKELQYLYFGGNKKIKEFMNYEFPKLKKLSPSFVYKTIAMEYYRNWLKYLIEGGIKPIKPNEEIAYKSIEDKDIINNNNFEKNKENNIITIDFYNDCYKYNDKYNRTITGFINNKEMNEDYNLKNKEIKENFIYNENNENNLQKISNKNIRNTTSDRSNYLKIINKNNYNKFINTENVNFFSFTQSNFLSKNKLDQKIKNNKNYPRNYNSNIIINIKEGSENKNMINNKENKRDDTHFSKDNKNIYIKPKHSLKFYKNINEKKYNSNFKSQRTKDTKNLKQNLINNDNFDKIKDKFITYDNMNKKGKINKEIQNNINIINKNKEKESKKEKNYNTLINYNSFNDKISSSSIKVNTISTNKIIFKKKNIKNYIHINKKIKNRENCLSPQPSEIDVISKDNLITQIKTDFNSNNNEDSISLNTLKTFSSYKSLKHFNKRNPRKMNKTKTNKRKKDKKYEKDDEELNLIKLKKEKSEIIKSLKVLMKKKTELEESSRKVNKK